MKKFKTGQGLGGFVPSCENSGFAQRHKGTKEALLAVAAMALCPSVSLAQEAEAEGQDIVIADMRMPPITVTATGAPVYPEYSGRSVTLLSLNDPKFQAISVNEVLSRIPGVTTTRNGGPGGFSAVRIRGAEGEQTLTLIDGVRVNDPASPGGGFDFGNLLSGNIERIEVLRGPNSVPWGSQAIGGVVNIVTAKPSGDLSGRARAEFGFRDSVNLVGNAGLSTGPISASFGGSYFKDDGISAFKGGTERDGYRQYAGNGKIAIALSDDLDLDFGAYYAKSKTQLDGFPPPTFTFSDTPEFSDAEETIAYAGANLRLFDDKLNNGLVLTLTDINRDNFDAPGQVIPSFLARGRTQRIEYQGDAQLSEELRTVFGIEHEKSRFTDGFSPASTSVTSGYAQVIIDPTDNLSLTGGARVDDHKSYGTKSTFSANLAWRPSDSTIIRAAYGEGFKAPTLFQLFSDFGNRTLNPEVAKSYEIGVEQQLLDDKLTLGITAFLRNTGNQIDFISCFGQTAGICTNRPFGTYDNVKRSRAKGIETFARIKPRDGLTLEANYSLISAKDRSTGLTLLRRPKHSFNANIDWEARTWLKLGASLQHVSSSADVDFQTFTRTKLGGYTLTSLRAALPLGETFEFYGRVENLFDEKYETVSGYGTPGRNAHVGVRAKF